MAIQLPCSADQTAAALRPDVASEPIQLPTKLVAILADPADSPSFLDDALSSFAELLRGRAVLLFEPPDLLGVEPDC